MCILFYFFYFTTYMYVSQFELSQYNSIIIKVEKSMSIMSSREGRLLKICKKNEINISPLFSHVDLSI